MRLVEDSERPEEHFTEGELDLEPPEELALGELDDEKLLEEDLDNEDVDEEDVDDVVLELTLDELVHGADDEAEDTLFPLDGSAESSLRAARLVPEAGSVERRPSGAQEPEEAQEADEQEDLELVELEDVEESLDRILAERLAGDSDAEVEPDEPDEGARDQDGLKALHVPSDEGSFVAFVSPCREDEFVCRTCFLVKKRAQLANASASICRDCES